jgi:hypothetical protein
MAAVRREPGGDQAGGRQRMEGGRAFIFDFDVDSPDLVPLNPPPVFSRAEIEFGC